MTKDHTGTWKDYWHDYLEAFAHPLTANGLVGRFVSNPNVTGAYAEAWISGLARSMLPQFRISTGAVIRPSDRSKDLSTVPQCDLIIWDPSDLPALFEQGDFAIVPWYSARALIEVKRTCTDASEFRVQLDARRSRLFTKYRSRVLGVVVSHPRHLFAGEITPEWLADEKWVEEPPITRFLDSSSQPDEDGVIVLIYFLAQIAGHGWATQRSA